VLETATGAEKRPARLAGETNGREGAIHAGVGTGWDDPDRGEISEIVVGIMDRRGGDS
jgi:hypothetical protein